jgi:hypothetical protein
MKCRDASVAGLTKNSCGSPCYWASPVRGFSTGLVGAGRFVEGVTPLPASGPRRGAQSAAVSRKLSGEAKWMGRYMLAELARILNVPARGLQADACQSRTRAWLVQLRPIAPYVCSPALPCHNSLNSCNALLSSKVIVLRPISISLSAFIA